MEARVVDWDEMEATHLKCAQEIELEPRSLHHREKAKENIWDLVGPFEKMPKKKSMPKPCSTS